MHGEGLKLGIEVAQSTVANYMTKRRPGSGQTWRTFVRNHAADIDYMDFLVVPTINFRLLFVLVILRHERQRLISSSVTDHPTAEWIARQITEAFLWDEAPTHLIRDRDGRLWPRRCSASGDDEHPGSPDYASFTLAKWPCKGTDWLTPPRMPGSHLIFGEAHLRQVLKTYPIYYNRVRTHLSLDKDAPLIRPVQRFGDIAARPILGGLHHQYCRM